jgi:hypothetical protein
MREDPEVSIHFTHRFEVDPDVLDGASHDRVAGADTGVVLQRPC